MSEESEDKQKQAKKLSVLSKLFGTPGSLFDLIILKEVKEEDDLLRQCVLLDQE